MIKKNDFILVDYTGRIKDTNDIFDLTDENTAKKNGLYDPKFKYGPKVICVGQKYIIDGLDKAFIGKEINKEYTVEISPEDAFGQKNSKLIKTVPSATLENQNIRPFPGLVIDASGMRGQIRYVGGGRVIIDFNHPLAGKALIYEFKIQEIIHDKKKQIESLAIYGLGLKEENFQTEVTEKEAKIRTDIKFPDIIKKKFSEKCAEILGDMKVTFV